MHKSRLSHLTPCIALLLSACPTEVVPLDDGAPEEGYLRLSNQVGGPATSSNAISYDVYVDGKPAHQSDGEILTVNSSALLTTAGFDAGTADVEFMTEGETVIEENDVQIDRSNYNFLILYGSVDSPKLMHLSDDLDDQPEDSRRVRVVNVRDDEQDLTFAFMDASGNPIPDTEVTLPYGTYWSEFVPKSIRFFAVKLGSLGYPARGTEFDCDPSTTFYYNTDPLSVPGGLITFVPDDPARYCPSGSCACPSSADGLQ